MSVDLKEKKILIAHSGTSDLEIVKTLCREMDTDYQAHPVVKCYSEYPSSSDIHHAIRDYTCDLLIVLNLTKSYASSGIEFLRTLWADIILSGKYQTAPPIVIMCANDREELRKQDPRFDIPKTDGFEFVLLGDDFITKIRSAMSTQLTIEAIKSCLLKSCEASRKQLEHDLRNYDGPYSLLIGAYYAGEFKGRENSFLSAMTALEERKVHEELKICRAASFVDIFQNLGEEGKINKPPLCERYADRKILLIDDEYETAGWEIAFKAIFGDNVSLDAYKGKNWNKTQALVDDIVKCYSLTDSSTTMPYDLILMDLYLSEQDKAKKKEDSFTEFASKKIIDKIRKKKKDDIPIILFTASKHAERIDALKETGGEIKYFPKKAFHEKNESKKYFNNFRHIVEQTLSQERSALRNILGSIKNYQATSVHTNNDVISPLLLDAHSKLKAFFSGGEIKSVLMDLANALEKHYYLRSVKGSFLTTYNHPDHASIDKFRAFICYNMRMSFQTHFDRSPFFEEVLFSFLLCLKIITGNTLNFNYLDPCPEFNLNCQAIEMLNSICQQCTLPYKKACWNKNENYTCRGKTAEDMLTRSMLLSLHANLYSKEARKDRPLFLYFYYILKLNRTFGVEIDTLENILIKYALMKRNSLFCPPYDSNGWDGRIQGDHIIDSPLGKLPAEMVEIVCDRFGLTERFRLG